GKEVDRAMARLVRIRSVSPTAGFVVHLEFTDGTARDVDLEKYLRGPVFAPLRNDPARFRRGVRRTASRDDLLAQRCRYRPRRLVPRTRARGGPRGLQSHSRRRGHLTATDRDGVGRGCRENRRPATSRRAGGPRAPRRRVPGRSAAPGPGRTRRI